jgi:hypothetical protein
MWLLPFAAAARATVRPAQRLCMRDSCDLQRRHPDHDLQLPYMCKQKPSPAQRSNGLLTESVLARRLISVEFPGSTAHDSVSSQEGNYVGTSPPSLWQLRNRQTITHVLPAKARYVEVRGSRTGRRYRTGCARKPS